MRSATWARTHKYENDGERENRMTHTNQLASSTCASPISFIFFGQPSPSKKLMLSNLAVLYYSWCWWINIAIIRYKGSTHLLRYPSPNDKDEVAASGGAKYQYMLLLFHSTVEKCILEIVMLQLRNNIWDI